VAAALSEFERAGACGLVTLHLAYSPSLESAPLVARFPSPVLVWNTTPSRTFAPTDDPDLLLYNHGIHGVQDFCNLLIRHRRSFRIVCGHWQDEAVVERVRGWCRGVAAARRLSGSRVGIVGEPFPGMADFTVPDEVRRGLGIEVVRLDPGAHGRGDEVADELSRAGGFTPGDDKRVDEEVAANAERFRISASAEAHRRSVEIGLTLRRWIEGHELHAVTVNFLDIDARRNYPAMPFVEVSKAMERGIGYAGEGDVITAAFVGALLRSGMRASFSEMFCPDWANDRIFLSHMGEANPACLEDPVRLIDKPFPFSDAEDTVAVAGRFAPGEAALVNLAPVPRGTVETAVSEKNGVAANRNGVAATDLRFRLIVVQGEIERPDGNDAMIDLVRGWFAPRRPVSEVLSRYSMAGGTHHLALVYGDPVAFAEGMSDATGWELIVI
jgi:L-arabinose isomerase